MTYWAVTQQDNSGLNCSRGHKVALNQSKWKWIIVNGESLQAGNDNISSLGRKEKEKQENQKKASVVKSKVKSNGGGW